MKSGSIKRKKFKVTEEENDNEIEIEGKIEEKFVENEEIEDS
jgi:hypothetical protein